jgi:hypothetical protein
MSRAGLRYLRGGDRWEAVPVDGRFDAVLEVDDRVRLLVLDDVPVGFVVDVDGDPASRLVTLGRYVDVESARPHIERGSETDVEGIDIEVRAVVSAVPARRAASLPVESPVPRSNRVRLEALPDGIKVGIVARWWFRLWGMWFTVMRGDGLIIADLPVPRAGDIEIVPNAVPVRPADLRGVLHRGPSTVRRVLVVTAAVVSAIVASMLFVTRSESVSGSMPSTSVATPVTPSTAVAPSGPATSNGPATSTVEPAIETRRPATQFVSVDGLVGLDLGLASDESVAAGGQLELEFRYDRSAINMWGPPDADMATARLSCEGNIGVYREVPTQIAYQSEFAVTLEPVSGGAARPIGVVNIDLELTGAMVEGCPEPTEGQVQYMVQQRTFYLPFAATLTLPTDIPRGDYAIRVAVDGVAWSNSDDVVVTVE